MLRRRLVIFAAVLACSRTQAPSPAPVPAEPAAPETKAEADPDAPASLAGAADRGAFTLYVQDTPLATIEYELQADGAYEGHTKIAYAGQSVATTFAVRVDTRGRWTRLDADAPTGAVKIVREGRKLSIEHRNGTDTMEIDPGTSLFENYSPALLGPLLRRYDAKAGGRQTVKVLVPGAPTIEAQLGREQDVVRAVDGKDLTFARWMLELPSVGLEILTDAEGRVVLVEVPSQKAAYVRDGYAALRAERDSDPSLSKAEHDVVLDDDVKVKMRDGTKLSVDVYRPSSPGKHPTIVVRTPYKKELNELQGRYFARRGYAYVVQDVRGRFASEGEWVPFVNERKDGYDTIEWAADQSWSTGKVGMIGASYLGWVQWLAAVEKPPHLVTIIPNVAPPDPLYNIPYEYGAFFMLGAIWWADVVATGATADLSGVAMQKIGDKKYGKLLATLPVIDLDKAVFGEENKYWRQWIEHPTQDAYWAGASYLDELRKVKLPVFIQSGWFDGDGIGSKLAYARLAAAGRKQVKLVLGPWGHTDTASRRLGDHDFGPEAVAIDLQREYLRWFDHWLKGVDNGIDREPLVSIFAMGSNAWLKGNRYPIEGTKLEKWYLGSDGKANGGGGVLGREAARGAESDTYVYDPADPTPHPDYFEEPERKKGEAIDVAAVEKLQEAHHREVVKSRKDILVYETAPMEEDTTFAGPITGVLWATTTAKDTDWFVSLIEIDAKGELSPLVQGRLRARYRASRKKPTLVEPGKVEKYTIDMWQTGITVKKGHKLRVEIASAAFPLWSRNLNTGGHNEKETQHVPATQTILHSKKHPSHIVLPRVKNPG